MVLMALQLSGANKASPQQPKREQARQQQAPTPAAPQNYAPYPAWQSESCYNAKDHNAADLCAQWRAAVAAEKAAHEARRATTWAIVATIFSAFAFGVLIWSLIQTERSLREARIGNRLSMKQNVRSTLRTIASAGDTATALAAANKSAEAAADQVRVAQESAYRQLRAYLSLEEVKIEGVGSELIQGSVTIRNAGNTPASYRLYMANWVAAHPLVQLPADAPEPIFWAIHGPYINARSVEHIQWFYPMEVLMDPALGKAEIQRLLTNDSEIAMYLYGKIEFVDFQRHKRLLHFAFRHNGTLVIGKNDCEMTPCLFGNSYEDQGVQEGA